MASDVRVRFAPSPTGYLHVGGARTALYNWLYARKTGGKFILRIEDTDQARSTEEALQMQMGDLKWLGLKWDEGPEVGGPYGPYKQSERLHIYAENANRLLQSGKAYHCFCSDAELEIKRTAAMKEGRPIQYDGMCRNISIEEAQKRMKAGEKSVVRFLAPDKDYLLSDLIRGEVNFPKGMVGDFVVLRSDGMPVYNFCCVVDDALMKITHVLRAEEHLSNTVRQMMLYEALDFVIPKFGHLSFILGPDKQKLSKRHGATSCHEYHRLGYLPEALKNYIALLGWSSPDGKEILSREEMIMNFGLDRFISSAAVFDEVKLKWVNATHIRALPSAELWKRLTPLFKEAGFEFPDDPVWQDKALTVLKTSIETLNDAVELFRPLSRKGFEIYEESKEVLAWEPTRTVVATWLECVKAHTGPSLSEPEFSAIEEQVKIKSGAKGKNLFMPIRVAIIGKPHGKELKLMVPLIPCEVLIERAEVVLKKLGVS